MSFSPIFIDNIASLSALGNTRPTAWKNYQAATALFRIEDFSTIGSAYVSALSPDGENELQALADENKLYKNLDRSVLLALLAARKVVAGLPWQDGNFGVNIGSSRGATGLFEKYHREWMETGTTGTLTSPTTTLGNLSSWVLQDLNGRGPELSHSITCSTALHSVLNGIAWMTAGFAERFLVGGSEAPLTDFTLSQMQALKLYAPLLPKKEFPNESLLTTKKHNSMILGEAACIAALNRYQTPSAKAKITGFGYAAEPIAHNISISDDARCLQTAIRNALAMAKLETVDAVVMHAPGTLKGDASEHRAVEVVFKNKPPRLTSNKFMIGHTFGASGAMSLEMAVMMLENQCFVENPHYPNPQNNSTLQSVLINAVGFGGNAVSLIVEKA